MPEKLKSEKELLDSKVRINIQHIESGQRESSQSIDLESLANVLDAAKGLLNVINTAINIHNTMVSIMYRSGSSLTSEVWKYLLENEIKPQLAHTRK